MVALKQKVTETGAELDACKTAQEQFSVEYYACRENSSRLQNLQQQHGEQHHQVKSLKAQKEEMEKNIRQKVIILHLIAFYLFVKLATFVENKLISNFLFLLVR